MSADHTFNRGIVHSLSRGQAGRQKAAQAENDRSKPLAGDASILYRNHYVHHSCIFVGRRFTPSVLVDKSEGYAGKRIKSLDCKRRFIYFHTFSSFIFSASQPAEENVPRYSFPGLFC